MELVFILLLGVLCGFLCSLVPGLHVNLVSVIFLSFWFYFPLEQAVVFLLSIACTMTVSECLILTYIGAAQDAALSILPAHKLVSQGRGLEAILVSVSASVIGIIACCALALVAYVTMVTLDSILSPYVGWLVLGVLLLLIARCTNKTDVLMVFLLSGLCGVLFLALPLKQPLLILFGGLFGIAGLIDGLVQKSSVVAQDTSGKCALPLTESFIGTGLSFFATFLPGLGTSQFSSFVSNDKTEPVAFLAYNASMNTTNVLFSIVALIALDNARSGAIAALMQIVQVPLQSLLFVSVVCVLSVCIAGVVTLWAARYVSAYFHLLPLKSIKLLVIIFLCGLIFWFDGFLGLCCVIVASAVGLYTIKKEAPKQYLMGCLLVPVLCFFLL